jgi:DNA-binding transcriptional LysR family regulator
MDILHLQCLLAVLNNDNFTEAGEIVHLSQSAMSKKIMALEQELDIKLLDRNIRNIALTRDGQRLMTDFIKILEAYNHSMMTLNEIKREKKRRINRLKFIGVPPISKYNVISLIDSFSRTHPEMDVSVDEMEMNDLLLTLQYGDFDLAVCPDVRLDRKHFPTRLIKKERFMIAVSHRNRFAKRKSVNLIDLKDETFILNRQESLLYDICVDACQNAGFTPKVMVTARPSIALEYLHSNREILYMGIRTELLFRPMNRYSIIPIDDSPEFDFVYTWKRKTGLSESAALFLEYVASQQQTAPSSDGIESKGKPSVGDIR